MGFCVIFLFFTDTKRFRESVGVALMMSSMPFFLLFLSNQSDPQSDVTHHDVPKITKD
jgi:hypothetical protein